MLHDILSQSRNHIILLQHTENMDETACSHFEELLPPFHTILMLMLDRFYMFFLTYTHERLQEHEVLLYHPHLLYILESQKKLAHDFAQQHYISHLALPFQQPSQLTLNLPYLHSEDESLVSLQDEQFFHENLPNYD